MTDAGRVRMTAAGITVKEGSKSPIIIGLGGYGKELGCTLHEREAGGGF